MVSMQPSLPVPLVLEAGKQRTKLVCGDQKAIVGLLATFLEALVIWLTTVGC